MIGYTELCQMEAPAEGKLAGRLERVLQAGHRARDLVNQILAFSRQEENDQKPVQVSLVVKEALKLLRASIPASIEFAEECDPDTGTIMADPTRIHQVLMNLCTNAAHAMQAYGGTLEVCLCNCDVGHEVAVPERGLLKPGPHIKLTVSDSGHGMDADTDKRIFDPYFSTKRQGEGSGFGLSITHSIVAGMQGAINVYSEPGEGTTFQVYLPRIDADQDPDTRPEMPLPRGSETILLVDDEEFVMEMTAELLGKLGYTVVPRNSSMEAYQAFQAMPDRFDLVITDQTMPKLTGLDLAARIRQIRDDIAVILITGFSAGIAGRKIDAVNIQAIMNKPVLKHELAGTVRSVLDNRAPHPA